MIDAKMTKCLCGRFLLVLSLLTSGCNQQAVVTKPEFEKPAQLGATIGSLGVLMQYGATPVIGHGIVAGLPGTGSSECDPALRQVLVKYIRQQMPTLTDFNPNDFINSKDTAVVEVYGVIPSLAASGEHFDIRVRALSSTQTTSLAGGTLFTTELKELSRFLSFNDRSRFSAYLNSLARAQGPIFIDYLQGLSPDQNVGYVLGGGVVTKDVQIGLGLLEANYLTASTVRNRLNERFGPSTAKAMSPAEILLQFPAKYKHQKRRFLALVYSLYVTNNAQSQQERIAALADNLAGARDVTASATGLEAIGKPVADHVAPLLSSDNELIRFHAARCLLNIGDDRGLWVLREIIADQGSDYRMDAIETVGYSARRSDALTILNDLLREDSLDVRLAVYEHLRRLQDISVSSTLIGKDFFVDRVASRGPRVVYVQRTTAPRIILFGTSIKCEENIFVNQPERGIIIHAQADQGYISLMRKLPDRPRPIGPIRSSFRLVDVIRTLYESPNADKNAGLRPGLGVSYADLIALLEYMCGSGGVNAEFQSGPVVQVNPPAGFIQ